MISPFQHARLGGNNAVLPVAAASGDSASMETIDRCEGSVSIGNMPYRAVSGDSSCGD